MDAAPTDVSTAQCRTAVNSGIACQDTCFCNTCPTQIYTCFTAPECAAVLTCIRRTGCPDPAACQMACLTEISAAGAYLSLLTNVTFQGCLSTCSTCMDAGPPDAGPDRTPDVTPDVTPDMSPPPTDAPPDNTNPDAPPDTTNPPDAPPDTTNPPDAPPDTTNPPDAPPDTTNPPDAPPDTRPDATPDNRTDVDSDDAPDSTG